MPRTGEPIPGPDASIIRSGTTFTGLDELVPGPRLPGICPDDSMPRGGEAIMGTEKVMPCGRESILCPDESILRTGESKPRR